MAGGKDKLSHCSGFFYGRQNYLRCKCCRKRYHVECINITSELLSFLVLSFKHLSDVESDADVIFESVNDLQ